MTAPQIYDVSVEELRDLTQDEACVMHRMCAEYHQLRKFLGISRADVQKLPSVPAVER